MKLSWDLARLEILDNSISGAGRCQENHVACGSGHLKLSKSSVFNKKCNMPVPSRHRGKGKLWKNLLGSGGASYPDVNLQLDKGLNAWLIRSVTCYTVLQYSVSPKGSYPVFGDNVTTDKKYGVRGLKGRRPSKKLSDKGYYKDVAANLRLYQGACNKPGDMMYWWVKDSTKRHEEAHHTAYRKWFESKVTSFLQKTARKLQGELTSGKLRVSTREDAEKHASLILRDIMIADKGCFATHETQVSAMTAKEFRAMADDILAKGAKAEAKPGK